MCSYPVNAYGDETIFTCTIVVEVDFGLVCFILLNGYSSMDTIRVTQREMCGYVGFTANYSTMHKDATRIKAMNEPRLLTSSTHAVLAIVYSASGWYIILLKFPNDDHE